MELAIFAKRNLPFQKERAMEARFASRCPVCHGEIGKGDAIYLVPGSKARHQNCCAQTGRTLAQIVVDYINTRPRSGGAEAVYTSGLYGTLVRSNKDYPLVVDIERTKTLAPAWAVFVDGSAMRPIDGDDEGRFETFDPQ